MEDKVIGFSSKNKKNKHAIIEVINIEDVKLYCNSFTIAETKSDIVKNLVKMLHYSQIKKLITLIDSLNMHEYSQKKIVIRVDNIYCKSN